MDLPTPVDEPAAPEDGADEELAAPPQDGGPVEELAAPAGPTAEDPVSGPQATTDTESGLLELKASVSALSARVDALAESFDSSVRQAVAEEVLRVAGELQHTVAALGRVLVRDLGRLNQILTQHRDTILAELHNVTSAAAPRPAQIEEADTTPPASPPEPAASGSAPSPEVTDGEAEENNPSRLRRGHLARRRRG
jgi:hypothetical protein